MSAIYLLFIALAWFSIAAALAYLVTSRVKNAPVRVLVTIALIAVMLPMPLVDEIVGKRQFEQLCRDNATIQVDREKAVGKTVYFVPQPLVDAAGTWVPIVVQPIRYVDATTGETVATYSRLVAVGGRLVQMFGFSEGKVPLLFSGTCGPTENPRDLFASLRLTVKDLPQQPSKE
jgi:hypothetical protein